MLLKGKLLFAISSLIIFLSSNQALALEQSLARICNDENKNVYFLIVDTTTDGRMIRSFYKDVYHGGSKVSREALNHRDLLKGGLILEQRDKYVVLKLLSHNFDEYQGGIISVDTLFNGANGTRKNYEISLVKDKSGWVLMNQGKTIKEIFIETNKVMLLGSVGIKKLIMK